MNNTPSPTSLEDRMLALEARIAELEKQCEVAQLNIPWHVICAAVAAVMPHVRVVRVAPVSQIRNQWRTSALLRNINSHQIR
jgi:hypothetical protein